MMDLYLTAKDTFKQLKTQSGRDTIVVFTTTAANILLGGLFFILVPRILGPADYGIFSVAVATGILAVNIANFGMDTGILRFGSKTREEFEKVLSLAFKSYLVLGFGVTVLGFLISGKLSQILGYPQMTWLLRIAFLSSILMLLSNFYTAAFQAQKNFFKASLVNLSSNTVRLLLILVAISFFKVGLYQIASLFFFPAAISVFFGSTFLKFKLHETKKEELATFFKFNSWIAFGLIIPSVPIDNYLLLKFAGAAQAGLYFAPFKILTFVYQFAGNLSRVLAPRFASFETDDKAKSYAKKAIPIVALVSSGLILLAFFSNPLVNLLFGRYFISSSAVFLILTFSFIIFFASTIPQALILFYFKKSQVSFMVTVIQTIVFAFFLAILIPGFKAQGAAYAFLISQMISFTIMLSYVYLKFKNG